MTQLEFIQTIAPLVQKYAKKYNIQVASPVIAQACLESGYGTSKKAQYHNYFGLKYRKNRVTVNNGYFTDGGSEQNSDGTYTLLPSSTAWYAFDSMEKGVQGYFQFINIPHYANLKTTNNPLTYLQYIKAANYATSLNYVQNVYAIINKWGLTKYDVYTDNTATSNNKEQKINIIQKTNIINTTTRSNRKIEYIVIHYTAGTRSNNGAAAATANWFANPNAGGSADFIVDDDSIVQYNPDLQNRYCWAVGGSKYSSMTTTLGGTYHGICTNANSISIEMCSRKYNTSTLNATDLDWYFTEETINNAVLLTKHLMKMFNIPINKVIMHHMVTGKICPNPWTINQDRLVGWTAFLSKVSNQSIPTPTISTQSQQNNNLTLPYFVTIKVSGLRIRSGPGTAYSIKGYVNQGTTYTIVQQSGEWGKLKSGVGWININDKYVTKKQTFQG